MPELGHLLKLEYGGALPSHSRSGHGYPVYGSNGVVGYHESALVEGPGIVVGRKGSVGKVVWSEQNFWPIDTTYYARSKGDHLRWLYRVLDWLPLELLDSSTGVPGLNRNDVYRIGVSRPPSEEQKKIAQILETLDIQIRQTEALIAKLERIKQGLLTDLLTRGIGQNGQLRPAPEQAPHLYKDSALGWIPKEWDVLRLDTVCEAVVDCPHSTPEYLADGVLVARTMHIKNGEFLTSDASHVSEFTYRDRIARLEPQPGDVIFTREAPVGEAFAIPDGMRICLGQRVMLLRPKSGKATGNYLVSQIYSGAVASRIQALTAGTTNPHLNVREVKDFLVPLPAYEEQQAVDSQVACLECRLRTEQEELGKLTDSKKGLMDDLLTGRVRVSSLLETTERATA